MKKEQIAYCLIRKNSRKYAPRFSPLLIDAILPIYWKRRTAENEAEQWDCDVVRVKVTPVES